MAAAHLLGESGGGGGGDRLKRGVDSKHQSYDGENEKKFLLLGISGIVAHRCSDV